MRTCNVFILGCGVDLTLNTIKYLPIAKVFLQGFVVSKEQTCSTYFRKSKYMLIVGFANLLILQLFGRDFHFIVGNPLRPAKQQCGLKPSIECLRIA